MTETSLEEKEIPPPTTVINDDVPSDKKAKKPKQPSVSLFQLFRFATPMERFMILIAIICSAGSGAMQPISIIIYGSYISKLTSSLNDLNNLLEVTLPVIKIMAYMGTAVVVAAYVSNCFWIVTGANQIRRIRSLYVHAVLRQDMSWYDKADEGSLTTRLANDTQLIQDGISDKFGQFVMLLAQFLSGFIVAFIKGKNTLYVFATCANSSCLNRLEISCYYACCHPLSYRCRCIDGYFYYKIYLGFTKCICICWLCS